MVIVQHLHFGQGNIPAIGSAIQDSPSERTIRMVGKTSIEPHSVHIGGVEEQTSAAKTTLHAKQTTGISAQGSPPDIPMPW
jgi:hypothetical protein